MLKAQEFSQKGNERRQGEKENSATAEHRDRGWLPDCRSSWSYIKDARGPETPRGLVWSRGSPSNISHSSCCLCTVLLQYPGKGCLARGSTWLQRC